MTLPIVLYNVNIRTMTASSIILRVIEGFSNYCASHFFHRRILCSIKCYMNAVNVTVWYYLVKFLLSLMQSFNELLFIKFFFSFHFILSCWLPLWFVSRKFTIEIQFMESYSNFENSTIYIFFFIQRFMKNMLYNQTKNNFWWKSKLKKRSKIFSFWFLSILFLFKFKKFYSFFSNYIIIRVIWVIWITRLCLFI